MNNQKMGHPVRRFIWPVFSVTCTLKPRVKPCFLNDLLNTALVFIIAAWRRTTAGTHFGTRYIRHAAGGRLGPADRKGRHQLFDLALAQRAGDPGIGRNDEFIKFIAAMITIIFVNGHRLLPLVCGY